MQLKITGKLCSSVHVIQTQSIMTGSTVSRAVLPKGDSVFIKKTSDESFNDFFLRVTFVCLCWKHLYCMSRSSEAFQRVERGFLCRTCYHVSFTGVPGRFSRFQRGFKEFYERFQKGSRTFKIDYACESNDLYSRELLKLLTQTLNSPLDNTYLNWSLKP